MELFGRLRLQQPDGAEIEYALSKAAITAGRAEVNDIVLADEKASRTHARFEWGAEGCTVVDEGSTNGVWVNDSRVSRAVLAPGDTIRLGDSRFLFHLPRAPGRTTNSLQVSFPRTDLPRLAVHTPAGTWEMTLDGDALGIGRDPAAEIDLAYPSVSRQHARVERRGDRFVLRDLGGVNGTWLGDRRIEEHTLRDGDTVSIGPAHLTFKQGFCQGDLEAEGPRAGHGARRTPVVVVPGLMGSELWRGSERVWPNVRYPLSQPEIFRLPETTPLEARAVVGEVVIVPNLIKLDRYRRVADYLVDALGYERGRDVIEFAYDWRQDVRLSAARLARAIDAWGVRPPVTIIAHSLGCLVSRWYVEKLGGAARVGRLILMGGPHLGAPRMISGLVGGPRPLPFRLAGDRLNDVFASFPSSYQLLPAEPCGVDQDGNPLDLFADDRWLPEASRPLLREAREFRRALGTRSSVPAVSIFGYGQKTITDLRVTRDTDGSWRKVDFGITTSGDEAVPQSSAVLPGSEIHPVRQNHGALYVDNDVKMRLKLELTRAEQQECPR